MIPRVLHLLKHPTAVVTEDEPDDSDTADTGDVPKWANQQAQEASKLKIVNMNRFHSSVQASRAQAAVMLAKALNLEPQDTSKYSFSDSILISSEDLGYILALREAGIVFGGSNGKFNPNSSITRAEIASMLAKAVESVEDEEDGTTADTEDQAATGDGTATNPADTSSGGTTDTTQENPTGSTGARANTGISTTGVSSGGTTVNP